MKFAVCVPPSNCDCYGHLTRYATQLAETGARRDVAVEILHSTSADFLPRLFANLADEDCVVHFHAFLYDLRLVATAGPTAAHALDGMRGVALATISDHPVTNFMQEMVRHAHPRTTFVLIEKTFADEMHALNPRLKSAHFFHQPAGPPQNYDPACAKPFQKRNYDLVVPIRIADLREITIGRLTTGLRPDWLISTTVATYHAALADLTRNPFHIFMEELGRVLGRVTFAELRSYRPEAADGIITIIGAIDSIVRQERRHRIVRALLREVGDLKVAVLGDPVPGLDVDKNVAFLGAQDTPHAIRLMGDTRAVLNCNPSYPSNLHERVSVGMLYGSCVISDVNTYMAQHLARHEFLPYEPGCHATVAELFKLHDIEVIGAAAARRTRHDRAFTWDAHFDDLVRIANAARAAPALAAAS